MNIPDSLPQLSSGHHARGSGNACIMDAISYISGDSEVTDMPQCVYPVLAKMAQNLNDKICNHNSSNKLCSDCSHTMWMIGQRLVGSTSFVVGLDLAVLNTQLAIAAARSVLHSTGDLHDVSLTAIEAAELWTKIQTPEAARAAEAAAGAAARAAGAARAARAAKAATEAAGAAAGAAGAASWAAGAAARAAGAARAARATAATAARAAGAAEAAGAARAASWAADAGPFFAIIARFEELTGFNSKVEYGATEYQIVREGARL